jgi:hypothetical protein
MVSRANESETLEQFINALGREGWNSSSPRAHRDFRLVPLNWEALKRDGLPAIEYLRSPYIPKRARIEVVGDAFAGKSLWALDTACMLTREGVDVVYISAENPLAEDARRLDRLHPDWSRLRFFSQPGIELSDHEHITELLRVAEGAGLCVLDTRAAVWSGDEDSAAAIAAWDRDVALPLVQAGTTTLVLDHTGHPQAGVARRGVHAGRGSSAKAQRADVILELRSLGASMFGIRHAKARLGGELEPDRTFRIVDLDDGGLGIEPVDTAAAAFATIANVADKIVAIIAQAPDGLTTRRLREAVKGIAGRELVDEALATLEDEKPLRVRASKSLIPTRGGRQWAKVWKAN